VLSNDSFQEFHGEHEWLFDRGRLIGGKPVPGIGWIFTARSPVRGPKSREAVRKSGRSPAVTQAIKVATDEATSARRRRGGRGRGGGTSSGAKLEPIAPRKAGQPNIGDSRPAPSKADAAEQDDRRRRRGAVPSDPVNEPMVFLGFVASHRPGSRVEGVVDEFTSHGAFVRVGEARCYLPLSGLGNPAPRAARDVVAKGETREFVVQALDPPRRGIELALPQFANPSGVPSAETVEQEINARKPSRGKKAAAPKKAAAKKEPAKRAAAKKAPLPVAPIVPEVLEVVAPPPKKAAVKKQAAKKAATTKTAPSKKAAAPKPAAVKKQPAAKKPAAPKKAAPAKKAPAAKRAAKKTAAPNA
jgi:hypothetical protein